LCCSGRAEMQRMKFRTRAWLRGNLRAGVYVWEGHVAMRETGR